jgi:hypothetical protein
MTFRIRAAFSLIFAAVLAASGSAVAQQPYPDLKGAWIGQMQFLRQGTTEHFTSTEETGPDFVEAPWTLVIDRRGTDSSRARGGGRRARGATRSSA